MGLAAGPRIAAAEERTVSSADREVAACQRGKFVRIAFLGLRNIGPAAAGGIEKAIEELSTRFVRAGHDVTGFCRARYDQNASSHFKGVRLKPLPAIYTKHLEAISNTVAAIFCALNGYDVIHINATGPALLGFVPRLFRKHVVVTVHGLDWKREKWGPFAKLFLRLGARAAVTFPQRTVVVSQTLKSYYEQKYRKPVTYIPNGVVLPVAQPKGRSRAVDLAKDDYLLFLGRLVPEKGCHLLIEAFRRTSTTKKLVIVGAPSHSEDYANSLRELAGNDPRIIFAGALFDEDKDAAYRNAYLFALPSTLEGMALVLLEAMSYGKCCVCSDIEENLEVIQPPGSRPACVDAASPARLVASQSPLGVRFRSGDVDDLARTLEALLREPETVHAIGERARLHVTQHFDWDDIAARYLDVYRDLVGAGS
jgi:glycosyltransferase involved in cell wall biosynthesis